MILVTPAPWLLDGPAPNELAGVLNEVERALVPPGARVEISGGSASVRARVAGAAAALGGRPVVAVDVSGCRASHEARLALGIALGALPPGDSSEVARTLSKLGGPLVILNHPADRGVTEVCAELGAQAPDVRWLCLSPGPIFEAPARRVPLPDGLASPLELNLAEAGHSPPWGVLEGLSTEVRGLAHLPAGVRSTDLDLPQALRRRLPEGRVALRHEAIDEIRRATPIEPSRAAARLAPRFQDALDLAHGAPVPAGIGLPEFLALRWLGEVLRDPDDAPRATAAAGRLLVAWGLPVEGRRLVAAAQRREAHASPQAHALLLWADAEAAHALGARTEATASWAEAEQRLRDARDLDLLAALTRHRAQRLGERGRTADAARAWRDARLLHRQLGDAEGVALTLRGAADLAVSQGEVLGAEALYEQADATPAGPVERASRRRGEAGLALSRGELGQAARLLDEADDDVHSSANAPPISVANGLRRRAELALRQGAHASARRLGMEAATSYGYAGEHLARAHTIRLVGDAAAAQGALDAAAESYAEAMALQVRANDLRGLQRTVAHARALALDAGLSGVAARLAQQHQTLEDTLCPPVEATQSEASGVADPGDPLA